MSLSSFPTSSSIPSIPSLITSSRGQSACAGEQDTSSSWSWQGCWLNMKAGGYACSLTCMAGDSAFFGLFLKDRKMITYLLGLEQIRTIICIFVFWLGVGREHSKGHRKYFQNSFAGFRGMWKLYELCSVVFFPVNKGLYLCSFAALNL